jgi:hypothetical protein
VPDYNLGRAHGEVVITADTRDATRGLGEYERAQKSSSQAASDASRIESELTRRRNEAEQAIRRRKENAEPNTHVYKRIPTPQLNNKLLPSCDVTKRVMTLSELPGPIDRSGTRIPKRGARQRR